MHRSQIVRRCPRRQVVCLLDDKLPCEGLDSFQNSFRRIGDFLRRAGTQCLDMDTAFNRDVRSQLANYPAMVNGEARIEYAGVQFPHQCGEEPGSIPAEMDSARLLPCTQFTHHLFVEWQYQLCIGIQGQQCNAVVGKPEGF